MVTKFDKHGTPYGAPPYTDEEWREIEKHLYGPPVAIYGSRGAASQPEPADKGNN